MKAKMLILVFTFFGLASCSSQEVKSDKKIASKDKPHEEYKVNRKYDEHGNLIEFDSTYTSYYSNFKGDTLNVDSIMRNFGMYFDRHFSAINSDNMFGIDSVFNRDFFSDNYFEKQFSHQDELMRNMMRDMDSIKNEYFRVYTRTLQKL